MLGDTSGLRDGDPGKASVLLEEVADVLAVVAGLAIADLAVVTHLLVVAGLARKGSHLPCLLARQRLGHCLRVGLAAHDPGPEGVWHGEKAFFKETLRLVEVGKGFSAVLDVRTQECRIFIDGKHLLLAVEVVLAGVLKAEVVVLERGGEDDLLLLRGGGSTFLAKSAVSSISLVLEVTELK
jgi:hypothetical protein